MEVKKFDKLLQGQTRSWTLKRCQIRKIWVKIGELNIQRDLLKHSCGQFLEKKIHQFDITETKLMTTFGSFMRRPFPTSSSPSQFSLSS